MEAACTVCYHSHAILKTAITAMPSSNQRHAAMESEMDCVQVLAQTAVKGWGELKQG